MRNLIRYVAILTVIAWGNSQIHSARGDLSAGAAVVNITPVKLPVIVNGGFLERTSDRVSDPLHARCLVLSDGQEKIAIVIADSCMIPRDVCDQIKSIAEQKTGIAANRILIAATHTHSAPSLMDFCLGTRRDKIYTEQFIENVSEVIVNANRELQPAEFGWTTIDAPDHTACRRWLRRPDRVDADPFGERTVRAMMHPGYQNADYLGPAGPADTELGLLSIRNREGTPICLLTNYSMHYVGGVSGISADYWGYFATEMTDKIFTDQESKPGKDKFVAMMSQGTSGDLHWMDYSRPRQSTSPPKYASELSVVAMQAYQKITYTIDIDMSMAEARMTLARRTPDPERLEWARRLNSNRGDRRPQNRPEVYAEQAAWIEKNPKEEIVLQAIRIGELGITAMPNEVFGVTGLSIKSQSPLDTTFNMELANGAAGYIPPPEQHELGGYTTWPARTAGLEVQAEPRIIENILQLLESVSGKKRRPLSGDLYPETIRANMQRSLSSKTAD